MIRMRQVVTPLFVTLAAGVVLLTSQPLFSAQAESVSNAEAGNTHADPFEVATFAAGCFWGIEALYERLEGVVSVEPGYVGGTKKNPTSEELNVGKYGYAEAVQVTYDPNVVTYNQLLEMFWLAHDPTSLNRQGADVGTKYRSMILYHNEEQKRIAEESMHAVSKDFEDPIVTEIVPLTAFYAAEEYNQDFYEKNKNSRYCRTVIKPKLKKMMELGFYD
jgi:peptide-methionine (S)-S-oxide reductase